MDSIAAATQPYSHGYGGRAPAVMLQELAAEFDLALPQLSRQQTTTGRTTATHAIGQLGGMTAIVLHDFGRHQEADVWFVAAARAAERCGNRQLHAWIIARRTTVPLSFGAPQTAARLANQAHSWPVAAIPPRRRWLHR